MFLVQLYLSNVENDTRTGQIILLQCDIYNSHLIFFCEGAKWSCDSFIEVLFVVVVLYLCESMSHKRAFSCKYYQEEKKDCAKRKWKDKN